MTADLDALAARLRAMTDIGDPDNCGDPHCEDCAWHRDLAAASEALLSLRAERDALSRSLANVMREENADTARLDKAEALLAAGTRVNGQPGKVHVRYPNTDPLRYHVHPTLRAALDACPEPAGEEGHDG
jgi:hypothetical protein